MAVTTTPIRSVNIITELAKSDTTIYSPPLDMVYAGGAGALAVAWDDGAGGAGTSAVYTLAAQGFVKKGPGQPGIRQVLSTGTAATLLVGVQPA